jgi:secreted trypsin-like serine protease
VPQWQCLRSNTAIKMHLAVGMVQLKNSSRLTRIHAEQTYTKGTLIARSMAADHNSLLTTQLVRQRTANLDNTPSGRPSHLRWCSPVP